MIQIKDVTKLYPAKESGEAPDEDVAGSIGKINPGEFDWLPRSAFIRRDLARWGECGGDFCDRAEPRARGKNRIYLSAVTPDSFSYCRGERHARAILSQHDRRKGSGRGPDSCGAGRPSSSSAVAVVRGRAATSLYRARSD